MQWKKFLIPPVAIYAVIFLLISAFIGATIDQTAVLLKMKKLPSLTSNAPQTK